MLGYKALKFGCIGELGLLVGGAVVRDHCPNGIPHLAMAFYWRNRVGSLEQWAIGGWSGTVSQIKSLVSESVAFPLCM
jgi:hypothetical protein